MIASGSIAGLFGIATPLCSSFSTVYGNVLADCIISSLNADSWSTLLTWWRLVRRCPFILRASATIQLGEIPGGASDPLRSFDVLCRRVIRPCRGANAPSAAIIRARISIWISPTSSILACRGYKSYHALHHDKKQTEVFCNGSHLYIYI